MDLVKKPLWVVEGKNGSPLTQNPLRSLWRAKEENFKGLMIEKSHGCGSWIRFREASLRNLVGGLEICQKR